MMKNNRFAGMMFLLVFSFSACEVIEHVEEPEDRITVFNDEHKNIHFNPGGGSVEANIISNTLWTASSDSDWCTVEPSSGESGNIRVTVSVTGNKESETRNARITFTAGSAVFVMNISQTGIDPITMSVTHKADLFYMPLFSGVYGGYVDWGDGHQNDFGSVEQHEYDKAGEKTVIFELEGEKADIKMNLHGVRHIIRIDLSGLR